MLGWALLGYITFVAGLGFLAERVIALQSEKQDARLAEQDVSIYLNSLRAWQQDVDDYNGCLARVETRLDNRTQWLNFYAALNEELGTPEVIATRLIPDLDKNFPPLDPGTCVAPGPAPVPPTGDPLAAPGIAPQITTG